MVTLLWPPQIKIRVLEERFAAFKEGGLKRTAALKAATREWAQEQQNRPGIQHGRRKRRWPIH